MHKLLRIITPHNLNQTYGLLGFFIMSIGLALSGPGLYYQLQQNHSSQAPLKLPSVSIPAASHKQVQSGNPIHIQIPSLNLDLPIAAGTYNQSTKSWTLSKDKAHFATVSSQPNDNYGNTFIYGHNRKSVFSKLSQLQKGALVVISTDNKLQFTYRYSNTEKTSPDDTSVMLAYAKQPTLSLQTCSGTWYQNRQIYRFDFVKVHKT